MKILLIHPKYPVTYWSYKHALKFISKKAANPPLGLITVAALLPEAWEKRLTDLNVTKLKESDIRWADLVFIGAMSVQQKSVKEVISKCKSLGRKVVAGGPLFTAEYENFKEVDHLILNEAEITLPLFLQDLENGCPQRIYQTSEHADITKTPAPDYSLIDISKYGMLSLHGSSYI